jgi:hypothetical protein
MTECSHVKANGNTCKSAAMKGSDYCYFHLASRDRIRRQRLAAEKKHAFRVPVLEDHETIQLAITDVVNAMFADRIDAKRAALALWALQTASVNLRHAEFGDTENAFLEYAPEHDPTLPELEDETPEPELPEKKPAASAEDEEVIDSIHATAEVIPEAAPANSVSPHLRVRCSALRAAPQELLANHRRRACGSRMIAGQLTHTNSKGAAVSKINGDKSRTNRIDKKKRAKRKATRERLQKAKS